MQNQQQMQKAVSVRNRSVVSILGSVAAGSNASSRSAKRQAAHDKMMQQEVVVVANESGALNEVADLTVERPNETKILLCAPSNNAVDELILRILRDGIWDRRGRRYAASTFNMVRVGASSGDFNSELDDIDATNAPTNAANAHRHPHNGGKAAAEPVVHDLEVSDTLTDGTLLGSAEKDLIRSVFIEALVEKEMKLLKHTQNVERASMTLSSVQYDLDRALQKRRSSATSPVGSSDSTKSLASGPQPPPIDTNFALQMLVNFISKHGTNFNEQKFIFLKAESHATNSVAQFHRQCPIAKPFLDKEKIQSAVEEEGARFGLRLKHRKIFFNPALRRPSTFATKPAVGGHAHTHTVPLQKQDAYIKALKKTLHEANRDKKNLVAVQRAEKLGLRNRILQRASIVCCTLSSSGLGFLADAGNFDVVLVDEASQAAEPSTLIPLQYHCKRLILVGDPKQLPATVLSQTAQKFGYGTSLFERLQAMHVPVHMLQTQYRMHPTISAFPNQHFYRGLLQDADEIQRKWDPHTSERKGSLYHNRMHQHPSKCFGPLTFFAADWGKESRESSEMSVKNTDEAIIIAEICDVLVKQFPEYCLGSGGVDGGSKDGSVAVRQNGLAVITPYALQVREIKAQLRKRSLSKCVDVNTVDGFQGREKDIILFSCVRSNNIGFLKDQRRMNVAITRARLALLVVGNSRTLSGNKDWSALMAHIKKHGHFIPLTRQQGFYGVFRQSQSREISNPPTRHKALKNDRHADKLSRNPIAGRKKGPNSKEIEEGEIAETNIEGQQVKAQDTNALFFVDTKGADAVLPGAKMPAPTGRRIPKKNEGGRKAKSTAHKAGIAKVKVEQQRRKKGSGDKSHKHPQRNPSKKPHMQ
jgi:hypothetical protein